MIFPIHIVEFAATEVERQGDGPMDVPGMLRAWDWARDMIVVTHDYLFAMNSAIRGMDVIRYRTTPVRFASGGSAANPAVVNDAMNRWMDFANSGEADITTELVKQFLDIHPFEDGNGRVAVLLWNYYHRTLNDPTPMPDFYG